MCDMEHIVKIELQFYAVESCYFGSVGYNYPSYVRITPMILFGCVLIYDLIKHCALNCRLVNTWWGVYNGGNMLCHELLI
jgi:hypothetical protein